MKYIIILVCLLAQITYAQEPATSTAKGEPMKYTRAMLNADVVTLIDDEVLKSLPGASTPYFSVSAIFITDGSGVVIKEYTQIKTHSEVLNKRIEDYINSLPAYTKGNTSDNEIKDKSEAHFINFTMLRDFNTQKFYVAENGELRQRNIKPVYVNPDEASLFPDCERTGNYEQDFKCTERKIYECIMKNFAMPQTKFKGQIILTVEFNLDTEGEIHIQEITGGPGPFQRAVRKAINRIPKLTPTYVKGIPVSLGFNLPITINLQ